MCVYCVSCSQRFRDGRTKIVVATDVAARGLDIPSVEMVVHFRLPTDMESFVHRYALQILLEFFELYIHFEVSAVL